MSYKYTITQEETTHRTKLTYEFSANDEDDLVEELNTFIRSIGYTESGNLTLVNDDLDDLDFEYDSYRNPEVETYKNFEFDPTQEEGDGQRTYNFYPDTKSTWPFPMDRPSQGTFRVDSNNESANISYYYGT